MSLPERLLGRHSSVPNPAAVTDTLSTRCGHHGIRIATEFVGIWPTLNWSPSSDEEALPTVEAAAWLMQSIVWAIALNGADLQQVVATGNTAAQRAALSRTMEVETRAGIEDVGDSLLIQPFFVNGEGETPLILQARYTAGLRRLYGDEPLVAADITDGQYEHDLRATAGARALLLPEWFLPFVHRRTLLYLDALPLPARAHLAVTMKSLANVQALQMNASMKHSLAANAEAVWVNASRHASEQLATLTLQTKEQSSMRLLLNQVLASLAILTAVLGGQAWSLTEAIANVPDALHFAPSPMEVDVSALPNTTSRRTQAAALAQNVMQLTVHPMQGAWQYATGTTLDLSEKDQAALDRKASDALKAYMDVLKPQGSTYRMPKLGQDPKIWQAWFDKTADFQMQWPSLNISRMLPCLTATVDDDDQRVLGWREVVLDKRTKGIEPTLKEFLAHVQRQVLPTGTTRRVAWAELRALTSQAWKSLDDCLALSTRLKQLFAQLYPAYTLEPEPVPRLQAVVTVHNMLTHIAEWRKNSKLASAWQAYTAYDRSQMFATYVDEALHVGGHSSVLCTTYLQVIGVHLEQAHRMYVQTHAHELVEQPWVNNKHLVAAAKRLGVPAKQMICAFNGSPYSGKRNSSGGDSDAKRPKTNAPAATSQPVHNRKGPPNVQLSNEHYNGPCMSFSEGAKEVGRVHPDLAPGRMRALVSASLPVLSASEVDSRLNQRGICYLCLESGHNCGACPWRMDERTSNFAQRFTAQYRARVFPPNAGAGKPQQRKKLSVRSRASHPQ